MENKVKSWWPTRGGPQYISNNLFHLHENKYNKFSLIYLSLKVIEDF
jgi:hypothetical protein